MNEYRKEHASVFLDNKVYVLGGYNSNSKKMLNSCETYDFKLNKWSIIATMASAKCAFAATVIED